VSWIAWGMLGLWAGSEGGSNSDSRLASFCFKDDKRISMSSELKKVNKN
jgi:hypothetical protein